MDAADTHDCDVLVVGAGPAGLAASTVAAERGHSVTLFDAASEIGGQFNVAKRVPGKEEFYETLRYFKKKLESTGVDLRLNTRVSVDDLVKALGADTGISKSEVSRICAGLDEAVGAFRTRALDHARFPYVYLDATYLHVRSEAGMVVSKAVVIATGVTEHGRREILGLDVSRHVVDFYRPMFADRTARTRSRAAASASSTSCACHPGTSPMKRSVTW